MISIVTITHNRRHFLPLAIENFNRIKNHDIEWIILDDSYSSNQDLIPEDSKIKYIFLNLEQIKFFLNQSYDKIKEKTFAWKLWYRYHLKTKTLPVGMKRNIANHYSQGEIIVHYDDDDYYPMESLNIRLDGLKNFDCVYCSEISCYNLSEQTYFQKGEQNTISEATMAYYREKWKQYKFDNYDIESEGQSLVSKLNCNVINSEQVIISIYHNNNTSIALNNNQIQPENKLTTSTIEKIKSFKDQTFCSQTQDLWILRDLFNYRKQLNYISIFPLENYQQLLDNYEWKGLTINSTSDLKNSIKMIKQQNFPKHINFLNISRRFDILEQIVQNYKFDVIIINYKNNLNFRKSGQKILQSQGMILTKLLNNEDCYLNQEFLIPQ
jgi:hypothetical protein